MATERAHQLRGHRSVSTTDVEYCAPVPQYFSSSFISGTGTRAGLVVIEVPNEPDVNVHRAMFALHKQILYDCRLLPFQNARPEALFACSRGHCACEASIDDTSFAYGVMLALDDEVVRRRRDIRH